MPDVSKSADGTGHGNTLLWHKVQIIFQVYPGTLGTDAQRAIAGVPYTIKGTGKDGNILLQEKGKLDREGRVEVYTTQGVTLELRIFDTDYLITVQQTIEEVKTLEGVKRRLSLLGYYTGAIDGNIDEPTDLAILNFQADSSQDAKGWDALNDDLLKEELKKQFGE